MLKAIDLASDKVEVFEFNASFDTLLGKELFLHEFENTVEIHALETDGSTVSDTACVYVCVYINA